MSIICDNCKQEYKNTEETGIEYPNIYGKICLNCGTIIQPNIKFPIIKEIERRKEETVREIKESLIRKIREFYGT